MPITAELAWVLEKGHYSSQLCYSQEKAIRGKRSQARKTGKEVGLK